MSGLRGAIIQEALRHVRVLFVSRETTKWWNGQRRDGDLRAFTGWYWIKGAEEAGPFRSFSAAIRDAYYRFVLTRKPRSIKR